MFETPDPMSSPKQAGKTYRASSIRPLARLFAEPYAVWAVAGDGRILYASAACGEWLQIDPDQLVGRGAISTEQMSAFEALDGVAQSLGPHFLPRLPAGGAVTETPNSAQSRQAIVRRIHPAALDGQNPPEPRDAVFIPFPDNNTYAYLVVAGLTLCEKDVGAMGCGIEAGEFGTLVDHVQRQLAADPRQLFVPVTMGESAWATRLRKQIQVAASISANITLYAPRGGGGEAVARLIHASRQSRNDLIKVAGSLMDAELFDATTGGVISRLMDDADETAGLLVLDLDQMPHDAQQRLWLVLHNYGARVRIFATSTASHIELMELLVPELATELVAFQIQVPTLEQRLVDLPMMALAMLQRRHAMGETQARQIARDAFDRLVLYPWPGNYEELDAAIRTAARQCRGEILRVDDLPLAIRSYGHVELAGGEQVVPPAKIQPLDPALTDFERRMIESALQRADGNRAAAARMLDISRGRLLRRIEQLGIDVKE